MTTWTEVRRRDHIDHMTKIEKMIWNAVVAVEGMPADPRLCEARNLLSQARELVGDFMDASAAEQRGEKGTAKP